MRPALVLLTILALSCGGGAGPLPTSVPAGPPVWPLRGTNAPDADAIKKRPIVVKIANDPGARPQSGLALADVILEIPVEGGLTRYAVVYHSQTSPRIGPVRSARQSDLNYLPTLRAILVHVGASESVAKLVRDASKNGSFVDVDEFEHPAAFGRISTRPAPYNAYTAAAQIAEAAGAAGRDRVDVPALQFDAAGGKATSTAAASLTIPYAGAGRVVYSYDAATGAYHRRQGGEATIDNEGRREVLPDNVIVIKTDVKEIPGTADVTGAPSVDFRATGTGAVVVLRDGKRFDGKWSRQGTEMYRFSDSAGTAITLKPGLTWMHIVSDAFDLSG